MPMRLGSLTPLTCVGRAPGVKPDVGGRRDVGMAARLEPGMAVKSVAPGAFQVREKLSLAQVFAGLMKTQIGKACPASRSTLSVPSLT